MAESVGEQFEKLVEIMRTLRSPSGCPWDREQTLASLRPFVLEETYEVLDAIDRHDVHGLAGELGDFLFEAVFLAQICAEAGEFTIRDSLQTIIDKLIRRHPHVFNNSPEHTAPITAAEVGERWEQIKAHEASTSQPRHGTLKGIPATLPSLLRAFEIGNRAAAVGFDWERPADVLHKIEEEVAEVRAAVEQTPKQDAARVEEEVGDLLFAIANLSRKLGVEPESALRQANQKFTTRFEELERRFRERGVALHEASLEEMEEEWRRVKDSRSP